MKPVEQTKIGMEGNCFSACVASILELPIEQVPEYTEEAGGWFFRWQAWLKERGLRFRIIPHANQGQIGYEPPAGWAIMNVKSLTLPGELHSVVSFAGEMKWNPHPERENGIGDAVDWYVFECLDPAPLFRDAMTLADQTREPNHPALREVLSKVAAILRQPWHPDSDVGPGDALFDLEDEIHAALAASDKPVVDDEDKGVGAPEDYPHERNKM